MAKKKQQFDEQYEEAYQRHVNVTDQHFVVKIEEEKPVPKREISETELQRRALQQRYKSIFGYKPTERDLTKLRALVEEAEQQWRSQ